MTHPKLDHHPWGSDYIFSHTFRPFVTFMHPVSYRSESVNTDEFGLREQYDADGHIGLPSARDRFSSCNVLVGGSTAFGVGASSDRTTVAALLGEPGRPCFNLGLRAASSRQELAVFLAFKQFLPPTKAIVLFSGVNDCLMAASPRVDVYPGYGAVYGEHVDDLTSGVMNGREVPPDGGRGVLRTVSTRLDRVARAMERQPAHKPTARRQDAPDLDFEQRLDILMELAVDTLETWSWIGAATGVEIHYVLQPFAAWTSKRLTAQERQRVEADRATIPAIPVMARPEVHDRLSHDISTACARLGLSFYDANHWLDEGADHLDVFYDVAHLTDEGNAFVAGRMREELECLSPAVSA